jgi:hypothetical protein
MLEVCFSCALCSRMFLKDCPYDGPVPRHLDPLLGLPCEGSGRPLDAFQELPPHPHAAGRPFGIHVLPAA